MMGDDHVRISAASKLAAKQLGCKVFRGSPYYRKEGACKANRSPSTTLCELDFITNTRQFPGYCSPQAYGVCSSEPKIDNLASALQ